MKNCCAGQWASPCTKDSDSDSTPKPEGHDTERTLLLPPDWLTLGQLLDPQLESTSEKPTGSSKISSGLCSKIGRGFIDSCREAMDEEEGPQGTASTKILRRLL